VFRIVYYRRQDGSEPAREWIKSRDNSIRPNIYRKLADLADEGLNLLNTNILDVIEGPDKGLYELRNRGLGWRLAVYHDHAAGVFVVLHGWHKDKNFRLEIGKARSVLHEYLETEADKHG